MGSEHTPPAANPHPNVGEAVVVLVRLVVGLSALMIRAGYDSDHVAAHADAHIRLFGDFHLSAWICSVCDVARFAVGAPVLDGNYEIFRE